MAWRWRLQTSDAFYAAQCHWFKQFTIVYVSASNVLNRQNIYGYTFAGTPDAGGQFRSAAVLPPAPRMLFVGVFISINKTTKVDLDKRPD